MTDKERIAELEGMLMVQTEALTMARNGIKWYIDNSLDATGCDDEALEQIDTAISATAETVQAYRDKLTEPLRREVAILNADNKSLLSIAIRCHDVFKTYGHLHAGLSADLLEVIKQSTQHIFHQQATAQAYEQEVEARGAVKALEDVRQHVLTTMHYTQTWNQQTVLQVIANAQLRATSKKAG